MLEKVDDVHSAADRAAAIAAARHAEARVNGDKMGCRCWRSSRSWTPLPTTEVLARYADGSPAATSNRFAQGAGDLVGDAAGGGVRPERLPEPAAAAGPGPFTHTPL